MKNKKNKRQIETIKNEHYGFDMVITHTDCENRPYLRVTMKVYGKKNQTIWCVRLSERSFLKLNKQGEDISWKRQRINGVMTNVETKHVFMGRGDDIIKIRSAYMNLHYGELEIDKTRKDN